jgi:hypothetical protein
MGGSCRTHGDEAKLIQNPSRKTLWKKRPFGRQGCRWEDDITKCIRQIGCEDVVD